VATRGLPPVAKTNNESGCLSSPTARITTVQLSEFPRLIDWHDFHVASSHEAVFAENVGGIRVCHCDVILSHRLTMNLNSQIACAFWDDRLTTVALNDGHNVLLHEMVFGFSEV
jgi:hypothetical protein